MELSKRLQAVASLVSDVETMADVGTDHGYIPIYLLKLGRCKKAIAMDVNRGPLQRANEHIAEYKLDNLIETRLSDGVKMLKPYEVNCVVIAGMGGALTIKIMEDGKQVFESLDEFVLQPQSELAKVRQYLVSNGFCVVKEDMIFEEGKYYPMMKVVKGSEAAYNVAELRYGRKLLEEKHPVLEQFLNKEKDKKVLILANLEQENGPHIEVRKKEIQEELEEIKYALQRYYQYD